MTYSELHTRVSTHIGATGIAYHHTTNDHINQWRGQFPLAVLDPPVANFPSGAWPFVSEYTLQLAFMDTIHQDSTEDIKRATVNAMDLKAREFMQRLYQEDDGSVIENVQIQPFFTFTFSSHLTAGVLLSLDYNTEDSFDYCSILETEAPLLLSSTPSNAATDTGLITEIELYFSEPVNSAI